MYTPTWVCLDYCAENILLTGVVRKIPRKYHTDAQPPVYIYHKGCLHYIGVGQNPYSTVHTKIAGERMFIPELFHGHIP